MSEAENLRAAKESRADIARRAGRTGLGDAMTRMVDAAVYRATRHPAAEPHPAEPTPRWRTLAIADGVIRYFDTGVGTPVLLVHGLFEDPEAAVSRYGALVPAGYRIIAPARFGYAGSTLPAGATPVRQADVFATLLDQLGIPTAAVLAVTSGATAALQLAIRHRGRVRALALLAPNGPGCHHDRPAVPDWVARATARSVLLSRIARGGAVSGLARRAGRWLLVPPDRVDRQHLDGALFDAYVSDPDVEHGYAFDRITAPTVVAYAEDDTRVPRWGACALGQQVPGARLVACAHTAELDTCDEVRALLA